MDLEEIQIVGNGFFGDSLTTSLRDAKSLHSLTVGRGTTITLGAVHAILKARQASLVNLTVLNTKGRTSGLVQKGWTIALGLKSIHLQADKNSILEIVR